MNDENETETAKGGRVRWPPYHWIQQQSDVSYFLFDDFWAAKYDEDDKQDYARYIRILELSKQGASGTAIEKLLGANNVRKYLLGKKRSFLTHLRAEHDRLGTPRPGMTWLPLRLKPRGTPDTSWIEVPPAIKDFDDIVRVLDQLPPTPTTANLMGSFGYGSMEELLLEKTNLFGFVLGVMLGDAGKPIKGQSRFPSMTISLTLSMGKRNGLRFGQYTELCTNASLGLAMHRIADAPSSDGRYTDDECYRWISPASPLIGWVFHVCMGLKEGERTTYDPLRMDWILRAPKEFQISFLQGVSESDGWVDAGADRAMFVSSPNEKLFGTMLSNMGIRYKLNYQRSVTTIRIRTESGLSMPIFNRRLGSNYYDNLFTMGTAKRFPPRRPLPESFINSIRHIISKKIDYSEMCLEIARTTGYKISSQVIPKYQQHDQ
jgi:hypothetical protein